MIGRLNRLSGSQTRARAGELLERFELTDAADRRADVYSGGMRRRLDLAAGLIGGAPIVLLDEPTTGLDPRSRQELWGIVAELARDGTTILLTTQYLDEADRLAAQIAVVDQAGSAPGNRVRAQGDGRRQRVELRLEDPARIAEAAEAVAGLAVGDEPHVDPASARSASPSTIRAPRRRRSGASMPSAGGGLVELQQPSLDDVFLTLTGHSAEEPADTPNPMKRERTQHERHTPVSPTAAASPWPRPSPTPGDAIRQLRKVLRRPMYVVYLFVQPVIFVLLFRYVFGGAINTGRVPLRGLPAARDHRA